MASKSNANPNSREQIYLACCSLNMKNGPPRPWSPNALQREQVVRLTVPFCYGGQQRKEADRLSASYNINWNRVYNSVMPTKAVNANPNRRVEIKSTPLCYHSFWEGKVE